MTSPLLSKGQNIALPGDVERIDVVLGWTESEVEVDASALLLGADRKVRGDNDFVFYNQPDPADGSVVFLGTSATEEGVQARIALDLAAVPAAVHTIALAGSVGTGAFGDLGKLALRVVDGAGGSLAEYVTADATTESAFVFGEIYRRGNEWKVRAVGQGWDSGLAGLATAFGVDIDEEDDTTPGPADDAVSPVGDRSEAGRAAETCDPALADGDRSGGGAGPLTARPAAAATDTAVDVTEPAVIAPHPAVIAPDPAVAAADPAVAAAGSAVAAAETAVAAAETAVAAAASVTTAPEPVRAVARRGVRTAKRAAVKRAEPMTFALGEDGWQPARLFSVAGIGAGDEQERRATSAFVATMQAVKPFARAICARIGAPVGAFEGYLEVQYERGDGKVVPDAVLRVQRGGKLWTALLEVKTGNGRLRRDQLENYLDVARRRKYDVVVSLSNDVPAGPGELPVEVDRRKLAKVALRHLSWAEVAHEARMLLAHGGIEDELRAWLLAEFLRYLEHPRSGASEFVDMGRHWVAVRDAVTAGTLRASDQKALAVADTWTSLSRHLALRLTAELGVTVKHVLPRKHTADPAARSAAVAERLAADGAFEAVLRIPETAGDLVVVADVRTAKIRCAVSLDAPDEGTAGRRVAWLLRQLKDAPADVTVEAVFSERGNEACERLDAVRADPKVLTQGRAGTVVAFTLRQTFPMGARRSGTAAGFVTGVTTAVDTFYGAVVQPLREWVPAAPKQAEPVDAG
ncbi:TerD family protein [Nocardia sp. NPDC057353]|uniref:TerD family protein n=1 Tax=Nocardia sp. NPDC057353 TaxID=3346104 RepID=UPI0036416ADA